MEYMNPTRIFEERERADKEAERAKPRFKWAGQTNAAVAKIVKRRAANKAARKARKGAGGHVNKGTVKERRLINTSVHSQGATATRRGAKAAPPTKTQHGRVARALSYLKNRWGRYAR